MKDRVLEALVELTMRYGGFRLAAGREPKKQVFVEPVPAPDVPILVKDLELVEKTGLTLVEVNTACVELLFAGKIRLTNSPEIFVNQNGHLYELIAEKKAPEAPLRLSIRRAIGVKKKFVDWEIYKLLGEKVRIEEINAVLIGMTQEGLLKLDAQWFNPGEAGYTYSVKQ